jgi:hypothetical protein
MYLFRIYLIGTFFSNFLPSVIGGDLTRVLIVNNRTRDASGVIAATFMERLLGFGALIFFVILILLQPSFDELFRYAMELSIVLLACIIVVLSIVIWGKASILGRLTVRSDLLNKVIQVLTDVQEKVHKFRSKSSVVIKSYLVSLMFYIISMVTVWAAASSLGVEVRFGTVMSVVPLVLAIGLLPVSVGGLGINESSYVFFFTMFGMSAVDAFSIALLLRARIILTAIVGAMLFLRFRQPVT